MSLSPLARSLLALAVVALLQSVCADPVPNPCTTKDIGTVDVGRPVKFELDPIPAYIQDDVDDISYGCSDDEFMYGERVVVCDDVAPDVFLHDWPIYTPVTVHRNGDFWKDEAHVFVTQYCVEKINTKIKSSQILI